MIFHVQISDISHFPCQSTGCTHTWCRSTSFHFIPPLCYPSDNRVGIMRTLRLHWVWLQSNTTYYTHSFRTASSSLHLNFCWNGFHLDLDDFVQDCGVSSALVGVPKSCSRPLILFWNILIDFLCDLCGFPHSCIIHHFTSSCKFHGRF